MTTIIRMPVNATKPPIKKKIRRFVDPIPDCCGGAVVETDGMIVDRASSVTGAGGVVIAVAAAGELACGPS